MNAIHRPVKDDKDDCGEHSSTNECCNDHSSYSACTASIQLTYGKIQRRSNLQNYVSTQLPAEKKRNHSHFKHTFTHGAYKLVSDNLCHVDRLTCRKWWLWLVSDTVNLTEIEPCRDMITSADRWRRRCCCCLCLLCQWACCCSCSCCWCAFRCWRCLFVYRRQKNNLTVT